MLKKLVGVLVAAALFFVAYQIMEYRFAGPTGIVGTNMRSTVDWLKTLPGAQEQFKQQNLVDQDADGLGEYGFLQELAGTGECRVSKLPQNLSPFISARAGDIGPEGFGRRSAFNVVVYLPSSGGTALGRNPNWKPWAGSQRTVKATGDKDEEATDESTDAAAAAAPPVKFLPAFPVATKDADLQEKRWVCYAWDSDTKYPTGVAYFVNQDGQVWRTVCDKTKYSGTDSVPAPEAAFAKTDAGAKNLDGTVGENGTSHDGNTWTRAERW